MLKSSKLYALASREYLFDEKHARQKAKILIKNGESVLDALTWCLLKVENFRKQCENFPLQALPYEVQTSFCRKIQNAWEIHKWIRNIEKEMEITNNVVIVCIVKKLPNNCISKVILDYLI